MNFLKNFVVALSIALLFSAPVFAFAQEASGDLSDGASGDLSDTATGDLSNDCEDGKICNPIEADSVQGLIKTLLIGIIKIGIPVIALAIIYSGFLYVFARGNPGKLETAHKSLLYTLIGTGLVFGAWAIAQLITDTVINL